MLHRTASRASTSKVPQRQLSWRRVPPRQASWLGRSSGGSSSAAGGGGATLASQHWLSRQRVLHSEPQPSDSDIIQLNVGGTLMATSRSTLRQVPGSLLALLFDPANAGLLVADAAGRVFLDHDPAAFALVLRFLRELRATGGCPSSVLLPAIPPADAAMFRSLAKRLGLQIADAAISAAELRGSAIAAAAAAAAAAAVGRDTDDRLSGSPYASRPASGGSSAASPCTLSPQQQQWWQQQLRRQQQQLVRPVLPGVPPSGLGSSSPAASSAVGNTASGAGGPSSCAAASPEAVVRQQQASSPPPPGFSCSSSSTSGESGLSDASWPRSSSPSQQQQVRLPQPPPHVAVEPTVQHFYLRTSPPVASAGGAAAAAAAAVAAAPDAPLLLPLRVAVQTEGDVLHHQQQQQRRGSRGAQLAAAAAAASDAAAACDIFCSVSSSPKQLLSFSFVARSSAGLDNVLVGVTSSNHADQRGLQIPAFGFRQINILGTAPPPPAAATESHQPSPPGAATSSFDDALLHQFRRRLWQAGDLVQVLLELAGNGSNRLVLKVNGQPVPNCHELSDLPTFRHWAWYLCLFRGTEGVAVVFEEGSVSVYSGDSRLKRFLA